MSCKKCPECIHYSKDKVCYDCSGRLAPKFFKKRVVLCDQCKLLLEQKLEIEFQQVQMATSMSCGFCNKCGNKRSVKQYINDNIL